MVKKYQGNAYGSYRNYTNDGPSLAVTVYRPSEHSALLPTTGDNGTGTSKSLSIAGLVCLALVFSGMLYQTWMHFAFCPPDSATRDAILQAWESEKKLHDILQRDWQRVSREQAEREADWRRATERHEREVERRINEENERQRKVRQEWNLEVKRHVREFEEMRSREKREWERERRRWRQELEERERREEEERQKRHMYWGNVQKHTCTTYDTREYSAQLMNLPRDWKHRMDACKATALEIHGISYLPTTCEDGGPGVVIGRWEVNQQEPDCRTSWESYNDKGCTSPGSGKKYITHKLMNLPEKSDWKEFCATTPAQFDNLHFPSAQECFRTVWGVYGQWEIDDNGCF